MSIAAFSAQRFYQIATGSPVERDHALVSLDLTIPERGLHIIDAAPDGTAILALLQGLIAPNKQRERFIRDIELRKIPLPVAHPEHLSAGRQAYYLSLNELQAHGTTLAALLGLTDSLVERAEHSRCAQCPTCKGPVPIFSTAPELCDELLRVWRGKDIEVDLVGAHATIEVWAQGHGFTAHVHDHGIATVRLDSFRCDETRTLQLQHIFASARRLHDTWFTVTAASERTEYAWNGRCPTCSYQMRPFQRSAARNLIERGPNGDTHVEASRLLEGRSLGELLACSLGDIVSDAATSHMLPPPLRDILETLGITDLSLGTQTNTRAPSTLAKVALVAASSPGKASNTIFLFDAPRSLFSEKEHATVLAVAETLAQKTAVLWVSEPRPTSPQSSPSKVPPAKTSPLGTIHLHDSSTGTATIQCGDWVAVNLPHHHRHERLGLALYKALQGEPSSLVTFSALHAYSAHFIPLFAEDSTSTRLVAHQLGAIEPLAKMFAASHQAKMLGLSPRDFIIGQMKQIPTICGTCKGTGLLHATDQELWQEEIAACPACWGARFRSPARDITFKGKTMWEILNSSIASCEQILRALPKMKEVFELTTLLGLGDIALGTPTALLTTTHRRMVAIVRAMLEATATKPSIIVVEAPFVGVDEHLRAGLRKVVEHPRFRERVAWVAVEG